MNTKRKRTKFIQSLQIFTLFNLFMIVISGVSLLYFLNNQNNVISNSIKSYKLGSPKYIKNIAYKEDICKSVDSASTTVYYDQYQEKVEVTKDIYDIDPSKIYSILTKISYPPKNNYKNENKSDVFYINLGDNIYENSYIVRYEDLTQDGQDEMVIYFNSGGTGGFDTFSVYTKYNNQLFELYSGEGEIYVEDNYIVNEDGILITYDNIHNPSVILKYYYKYISGEDPKLLFDSTKYFAKSWRNIGSDEYSLKPISEDQLSELKKIDTIFSNYYVFKLAYKLWWNNL